MTLKTSIVDYFKGIGGMFLFVILAAIGFVLFLFIGLFVILIFLVLAIAAIFLLPFLMRKSKKPRAVLFFKRIK